MRNISRTAALFTAAVTLGAGSVIAAAPAQAHQGPCKFTVTMPHTPTLTSVVKLTAKDRARIKACSKWSRNSGEFPLVVVNGTSPTSTEVMYLSRVVFTFKDDNGCNFIVTTGHYREGVCNVDQFFDPDNRNKPYTIRVYVEH